MNRRRYPKSIWSYNPIPSGCIFYLPFWHPSLAGPVFKSPDPFGHTATVTGAVYQGDVKGRFFDGATGNDDKIVIPKGAVVDNMFDGGGTIAGWINVGSDGGSNLGSILHKTLWGFLTRNEVAGKVKLQFDHAFTGDDYIALTTTTQVTINTYTHVASTYNSNSTANLVIIYVDGVVVAHSNTVPTGTRNSDAAIDLHIGAHPSVARVLDGNIIETTGWNRILSPDEIIYHRAMSRRNL